MKADQPALGVMFGQSFAANQILSIFLQTQRVFATMSGLQFLMIVSADRRSFCPTSLIAAEVTIAEHHRNNNRQLPLQ